MTRILLVRFSSLRNVLHTFLAATDLRRATPTAALDWVVEEAYAPLLRMYPGVSRAIPVGKPAEVLAAPGVIAPALA